MDEKNEILALLPETLPHLDMMRYVDEAMRNGGLGEHEFMEFHRESAVDDFDTGWIFNPNHRTTKRMWAAQCTCGMCGESWQSGWIDQDMFMAYAGDDGCIYPGVPDGECADPVVNYCTGETLTCPICEAQVTILPKRDLRNGRTYRCMSGRVETLGDFTAVVFWMLERSVNSNAVSTYEAYPWMALVIGRGGNVYRFCHTANGMYGKRVPGERWVESPHMGEPLNSRYYCYGAINGTMVGGYLDEKVPDQTGKTGEKTGLDAYIRGGGEYPLAYLLRQKRRPYLENLVRAGWTYLVDSAIWLEIRDNARMFHHLDRIADLKQAKPYRMLGMTREEVQHYAGRKWDVEDMELYRAQAWTDAAEFSRFRTRYGVDSLKRAFDRFTLVELRRIDAYLRRQAKRCDITNNQVGLVMYRDYRRMCDLAGSTDFFPPDLRRAHDRLTVETRMLHDTKFDARFVAIAEKWAALEWSDGAICAVLPRSGVELVAEGEMLHNCVGGYAETHAKGKIIVFIRHARRPERSWYTLNIDLTGRDWKRIQLHGYHNEWVNGKELHIPKAVSDFVDRWEREVLTPTFAKVKELEAVSAKKNKKKKAVAA